MATSDRQWQPKLGGAPGSRVFGLDELEQALRIILKTPVNSVPGLPNFGSRLHELMDEDVTSVAPKIVREVNRAVRESDPRITVLSVTTFYDEAGHVRPRVRWKPTNPISDADALGRTTEVS